jgi:hypothetical protein
VVRAAKSESLLPGEARAFFVRERFDVPEGFEGLLELRGDAPFHSIALRSLVNPSGDFALTPYAASSATSGPVYFAHLVADSSYSTDILCWNPGAAAMAARLDFFGSGGSASPAGSHPASSDFVLQPGQLRRFAIPASAQAQFHGYARLTLVSGNALPMATAIIARREGGSAVSEAAVPATPGSIEQRFVVAERAAQKTGLAILNPSAGAVAIDLELAGSEEALATPARTSITLQPGEKRAFFLYELFPALPQYLNGFVQVRASPAVASLALLGINNERGEFLLASLTAEPATGSLEDGETAVLPRIATGSGYRTTFYLLSWGTDAPSGRIRFFDTAGAALPLLLR